MAVYDEREFFIKSEEDIKPRKEDGAAPGGAKGVQEGASANTDAQDDKKFPVLSWLINIVTGRVLMSKRMRRVFVLFMMLGGIFFCSIAMIFASLKNDLRCKKLETEVALLKERAVRTSEACYNVSSHSSILNMLKERGINIEDPKSQPKILK